MVDWFEVASRPKMNWTPLLEGKAATQALATAWEIAEAVEEPKGADESFDASLSGGHAGVALLHAYLAAATDSKLAAARAEGRLDKALNNAQSVSTVGLFGGLAGVAWAFHHVTLLLEGKSAASETAMEEIDSVLAECLATQPWPWEYDLVYGLVGIGLYALDHPLRSIGESLATEVVRRLAELGEESDTSITWKTKKELIHPGDVGKFPEGRYDLGMAHGVAGVVKKWQAFLRGGRKHSDGSPMPAFWEARLESRWPLLQGRPTSIQAGEDFSSSVLDEERRPDGKRRAAI